MYPYCCGWDGGPGNWMNDPKHCGSSEINKQAIEYGAPYGIQYFSDRKVSRRLSNEFIRSVTLLLMDDDFRDRCDIPRPDQISKHHDPDWWRVLQL